MSCDTMEVSSSSYMHLIGAKEGLKSKRRKKESGEPDCTSLSHVLDLPDDTLCEVFSFLEAKELQFVTGVCQSWTKIAACNFLWKPFCRHCFPVLCHDDTPVKMPELTEEAAYKKHFLEDHHRHGLYKVHQIDDNAQVWRWKIKNFSAIEQESIYSEVFTVGGHPWRLLVFPKGNKDPMYFAIYLDVADADSLDRKWKRSASYSLALLNRRKIQDSIKSEKVLKDKFNKRERDWGYRRFVKISNLQSDGFIHNNSLTIEILISVLHQKCCSNETSLVGSTKPL